MKVLFIQDGGFFTWGGGLKLNRLLAHELSANGWDCKAVVLASTAARRVSHDVQTDFKILERQEDYILVDDAGVSAYVYTDRRKYFEQLRRHIEALQPDCLFMASLQNGYVAFKESLSEKWWPRTVLAVHVLSTLPFGPYASRRDRIATDFFRRVGGIVTVSNYVAQYIETHSGAKAHVFAFPAFGRGPFPDYGKAAGGFITLINAGVGKGLPIFLRLAQRMPEYRFAAVKSWNTTPAVISRLRRQANITILEPAQNVNEIFERTRLLLVPSLWMEAFGLVVIEAMLRGIPVLASAIGGLPEAKLGVEYVLPVRPIVSGWRRLLHYSGSLGQPIDEWIRPIRLLSTDAAAYRSLSERSRSAALKYVNEIDIQPFDRLMRRVSAVGAVYDRPRP
jgi:glycosyltransferase involved in cell wall biosynthesis